MQKEVRFLWPVYLMNLFFSANFYLPIWILFYQSRGLNIAEIGFVLSGTYLASFIFEYPTGIFADKYGRKLSLLISLALVTLSLVIEVNSFSVLQFYIASLLFGCGWAFSSGSLQALVYDSLKDRKLEKLNSKVLGIIDVFSSVGAFVAAFIGAFFYSFNNTLPYWITMLTGGAGFISLLFFKEPKYKKAGEKIYFFKNFKTGLSLLWKNPVLYSLLILYIPLFFFDEAWYTAKQPFLIQLGLPLVLLGAYEAFKNLFFIIGGLTLPKLLNKFGHKTLLAGVVIAQALTWWILGTNNLYAVVIFSYSLILWRQFWTYIDADIIHKHIHSSVRATTLSARQMIISAIFIFNPWMMGYLVNSISRNILFPIFGLIVLIIAGSVFLARRKYF